MPSWMWFICGGLWMLMALVVLATVLAWWAERKWKRELRQRKEEP